MSDNEQEERVQENMEQGPSTADNASKASSLKSWFANTLRSKSAKEDENGNEHEKKSDNEGKGSWFSKDKKSKSKPKQGDMAEPPTDPVQPPSNPAQEGNSGSGRMAAPNVDSSKKNSLSASKQQQQQPGSSRHSTTEERSEIAPGSYRYYTYFSKVLVENEVEGDEDMVSCIILKPEDKKLPSVERRLSSTPIVIGRYVGADFNEQQIVFKSKVVSRSHAEIWEENKVCYIKDNGSQSGTFLNAMRLSAAATVSKPYKLKNKDVIQFGVDYKGAGESSSGKQYFNDIELYSKDPAKRTVLLLEFILLSKNTNLLLLVFL